jgi:AcrR family transcriptional regulator
VSTVRVSERPRRADAERNRAALVGAARRVFERDGYVAARITDIAEEAGVAHGSFYSHFDGKPAIFTAVMAEVEEEMLHPGPALPTAGSDPVAVIEAANRAYLEAYQRNARLMALLEQVATVDEGFRELRRRRSAAFLARNARAVRRLQRAGWPTRTWTPTWPRWPCPPWSAAAPTPSSCCAPGPPTSNSWPPR